MVAPDATTRDILALGTVLNERYKIGRLLGRGGFGATYLAWDTKLDVRIAIKEFLPLQVVARDPGTNRLVPCKTGADAFAAGLAQFLNEAKTLAQFRTFPDIISVLDYFAANNTGYMVMEYLDGETLDSYVRDKGRLEPSVALHILLRVVDALRVCHKADLIHRDVSPDNIFLTTEGDVKLLDFGAARFAVGNSSTNLSVILKEGYAPFEQYQRNGRQGAWTDIYALTGTLYRLVTGHLPVSAPDRVGGAPLPTLASFGVVASPGLQALIDKGLAVTVDARYQTIDAFLNDIRPLPEVDGIIGRVDSPVAPSLSWMARLTALFRKRKVSVLAVGGGALAIFLAFLVVPLVNSIVRAPPRHDQQQTEIPSGNDEVSVASLQQNVRQATEDLFRIRLSEDQIGTDEIFIRAVSALIGKTAENKNQLNERNADRQAALDARGGALNHYLSQIDWLAGHKVGFADAAIEREQAEAGLPSHDPDDARRRQAAIRLVQAHLAARRDGSLSQDKIFQDVKQL